MKRDFSNATIIFFKEIFQKNLYILTPVKKFHFPYVI